MGQSIYIITDGSQYLRLDLSNKYKLVKNVSLADTWRNKKTALSILKNEVSCSIRKKCYVAEYKDGKVIPCEESNKGQNSPKAKKGCSDNKKNNKDNSRNIPRRDGNKDGKTFKLELCTFGQDMDLSDLESTFNQLNSILLNFNTRYDELKNMLQCLDLIRTDIFHYYGRRKLNARDGYKLSKIQQDIFLKRAMVKNELEIMNAIKMYYDNIHEAISNICAKIDKVKNAEYKPRFLLDLYDTDNIDIDIDKLCQNINACDILSSDEAMETDMMESTIIDVLSTQKQNEGSVLCG